MPKGADRQDVTDCMAGVQTFELSIEVWQRTYVRNALSRFEFGMSFAKLAENSRQTEWRPSASPGAFSPKIALCVWARACLRLSAKFRLRDCSFERVFLRMINVDSSLLARRI